MLSETEINNRAIYEADKEPDKILRVRRNVKHGSIVFPPSVSDLCELSDLSGSPSLHPAKGGFRINERLPIGLRVRILVKFDNAGVLRKKGSIFLSKNDCSRLYLGLPGQGEPGRSNKGNKCGFESLKHGDVCGTLEGERVIVKPDQFRHCNNINCPICWVHYCKDHANKTSSLIWDTRDKLAREGYTPMVYHVVLSCPQPYDADGLFRCATREGFDDLRTEAGYILKELGALGGALFFHPFRENGKDGIKNGELTGNDGDPEHWRLAPHFHAIVIFDGPPSLSKVADLYDSTGFVINFKTPEDEKIRGSKDPLAEARIKTLADCRYLCNYLYSHIGVIGSEDSKRRLPGITYIDNSRPKKIRTLYLRPGVPLLLQGYTARYNDPESPELHGQPLYWRKLLIDLSENPNLSEDEIHKLSEVELVNSAFVRCASYNYDYCKSVLDDEYKRQKDAGLLHPVGHGKYDFDVAELWRLIRGDPAFITQFEPMEEELRNPRMLQVDGEQLGYLFGSSGNDLYDDSPDYSAYCMDADRREAELYAELQASRERLKGRDNPPEGAGKGPAVAGGSPSGNDRGGR